MSFSKKQTQSSSSTSYSSTTSLTDQSANAGGEGSIAVGPGASLNIETLSDNVALSALDSNKEVSKAAIDSSASLAAGVADKSSKLAMATINTVADTQALVYKDQEEARNRSALSEQNNTSLARTLSELAVKNVAESKRDPDNQLLITLGKYAAIALSVVTVGYFLARKSK